MLATAALAGLMAGTAARLQAATSAPSNLHNASAGLLAEDSNKGKHDCKGLNSCKGQGGCKTANNSCKGQNSCKGKGGCATNGPA